MPIKHIAQDPNTLAKGVAVGYGYTITGLMLPEGNSIYVDVNSVADVLHLEFDDEVTRYGYGIVCGQGQCMQVISIDQLNKVLCDLADEGNNVARLIVHASISYVMAKIKQVDTCQDIG